MLKYIIIALLIYGILLIRHYADVSTQEIISPLPADFNIISPTPTPKTEDPRIKRLYNLLDNYNSPLDKYAEAFIRVADVYNLDWKLLPSIACAESSCGKNYKNNAFGWGSDHIDFGTDIEDFIGIAGKISTLHYYKTYLETRNISDFSMAYNRGNAEAYEQKLRFFYEKLE